MYSGCEGAEEVAIAQIKLECEMKVHNVYQKGGRCNFFGPLTNVGNVGCTRGISSSPWMSPLGRQ